MRSCWMRLGDESLSARLVVVVEENKQKNKKVSGVQGFQGGG